MSEDRNPDGFEVGDVVSVKSEDVLMTIERIYTEEAAATLGFDCGCVWFDGEDHLHRSNFLFATLEYDD